MKPLISIIVPVYKVERYLDECVHSLINQTYSNLEIILVDDGSPDRCPQMCDDWALRDKRIRVIHKVNGGLSAARNAGLKVATGDYISFVDSDDFFDKKMYEILYEGITRSSNIGISAIQFLRYESGKADIYNLKWDIKKDVLIKANDFGLLTLKQEICHAATNKLYKREVIGKTRFREGKLNEDTLFSFDISKNLESMNVDMCNMAYYAYYYRMRSGSIGHSNIPLHIPIMENLQTIICETNNEEYKNAASQQYYKTLFNFILLLVNTPKDSPLRKKYWDVYYKSFKNLHCSNLFNNNMSIRERFSLFLIFNCPHLYYLAKYIKNKLF